MNKEKLQKYKEEAYNEGENDTITENHLLEGAELFISSEITEEITDEENEEITQAYRFGFLGKPLNPKKVEKCYCSESGLSVPHYKDDH